MANEVLKPLRGANVNHSLFSLRWKQLLMRVGTNCGHIKRLVDKVIWILLLHCGTVIMRGNFLRWILLKNKPPLNRVKWVVIFSWNGQGCSTPIKWCFVWTYTDWVRIRNKLPLKRGKGVRHFLMRKTQKGCCFCTLWSGVLLSNEFEASQTLTSSATCAEGTSLDVWSCSTSYFAR